MHKRLDKEGSKRGFFPEDMTTPDAMTMTADRGAAVTRRPPAPASRYFYLAMSLLVLVPIAYGFSFTVGKNLIHPSPPRPRLLYLHAAVFTGWLAFFIMQTALVATRHVKWHRRAGWFGVALGVAIVTVGVSTAVTMGRFDSAVLHATDAEATLIIPLFDMTCFSFAFGLAIVWRRRPEWHRRLMVIATCALTAAGFGRFPEWLLPPVFFYGGVDALILVGVARDLIVDRRVHPVYRVALPALIAGQAIVTYTALRGPAVWMRVAHALLR